MNEPFLLSNLIELQELDNEIFKLISKKSDGSTVKDLKTHKIEFKNAIDGFELAMNNNKKSMKVQLAF